VTLLVAVTVITRIISSALREGHNSNIIGIKGMQALERAVARRIILRVGSWKLQSCRQPHRVEKLVRRFKICEAKLVLCTVREQSPSTAGLDDEKVFGASDTEP
jgi:hypothetical protein